MKLFISGIVIAACNSPPGGHVDFIDAPAGTRDVAAVVRVERASVVAMHRRLVVYVGATWCEPCQQIHTAITSHLLDAEFPDLTLLAFDLDRDDAALERAGYSSPLIPLFALPAGDGHAGLRREYGGQKDIDNVPLLTAKLHRLLDVAP